MLPVAPRDPFRGLLGPVRGALMGMCLWLAGSGGALACLVSPHLVTRMPESLSVPGPDGSLAWYDGPSDRYDHGILGDAIEGTELHAYASGAQTLCGDLSETLPEEMVFEDTAPRLVDLDLDGRPEIIVVQSHQTLGAQLAIYASAPDGQSLTQIAATPFIGRRNRWMAPIGAGDLDGDGRIEIAYIDRPHLSRTLRVWRMEGGALVEIAALDGLTNHRIGEATISGGLRDCGAGPEMITANAGWSHVMATRLTDAGLQTRALAPWSAATLNQAMACTL